MKKSIILSMGILLLACGTGCQSTVSKENSALEISSETPTYPDTVSTYEVSQAKMDCRAFRDYFIKEDQVYEVKELQGDSYPVDQKFPKRKGSEIKQSDIKTKAAEYSILSQDKGRVCEEYIVVSTEGDYESYGTKVGSAVLCWIPGDDVHRDTDMKDCELDFATKEQVKEKLQETFQEIGMDVVIDQAEFGTINQSYYEEYNAEYQKRNETETNYDELMLSGGIKKKDFVECYYITIPMGTDGIPVFDGEVDFTKEEKNTTGSIHVIYSENGIELLEIDRPLVFGNAKETSQKIVPYEDAVQMVKKKYENVAADYKMQFEPGELQYLVQQDKQDGMTATPVWVFRGFGGETNGDMIEKNKVLIINAISGEWVE